MRTRLRTLKRLHRYHADHCVSVKNCADVLIALGWNIHSALPLLPHEKSRLLAALQIVENDENVTSELFEGHALLVASILFSLNEVKGNYLSKKDAMRDIREMMNGMRRTRMLRRNAIFLKYCILGMKEIHTFSTKVAVPKQETTPCY